MARRSRHGPDVLKGRIVDAAEEMLSAGGLEGLTARTLAERVECSPGTLYNVFESLGDVVRSVEARLLDRLAERIVSSPPTGEARTDVLRMAELYHDFSHEFPRLWSLLLEHALPAGDAMPDWHRDRLTDLLGAVERRLAPLFPGPDAAKAALAARVLWAGVHGICSLSVSGRLGNVTPESSRSLVRDLAETYLAGLAARAGSFEPHGG